MLFVDSYLYDSVFLSSLNKVSCLLSTVSFNSFPFVTAFNSFTFMNIFASVWITRAHFSIVTRELYVDNWNDNS